MSWMIPYFTSWVYNGIVFGPPTVCPPRHMCGRQHYGEIGPDPTL
jgi:hypothetical protein